MSSQNTPGSQANQDARKALVKLVRIARDGGVSAVGEGATASEQVIIDKVQNLLDEVTTLLGHDMEPRMQVKGPTFLGSRKEFDRIAEALAD